MMSSLAVCRYRSFTNGGRSYAQQGAHPSVCLRNSKTHLRGREKARSGKPNAALVGPSMRSGLEAYNNVEDKTEMSRDSAGL